MKRLFCALSAFFCLALTTPAQSFYDNFTRGSDPGPLGAWTVNSGTWTVTGSTFQSGLNPAGSYAFAYITNNFTNYTVQARVKFPAGAFGGGLGGRVNTSSGAHYAAWVYPENSIGGSNVLKLIKFQNFGSFSYLGVGGASIATANLAAVGTGFHTVRMNFQTNRITVFFDGVQMITTNDIETTYYTNGAVMLDMWTDASQYLLTVDDVAANGSLALTANSDTNNAVSGLALTVAAPGILANDTGGAGPLAASLVTNAARGILTLSSNGGFTYTATNGFSGTDTFAYRANDGVSSSTNIVAIIVSPDAAPVANGDFYSTALNTTLNVPSPGILANDTDVDGNSLTAVLGITTISGTLTLTNNGGFTYVPNNGFVGSDSFTYRASDGISNSALASVTISVQPPGPFSDDFTRGTDPGPLAPWVTNAGNWSVTGGQLKAGLNSLFSYGFIYITNSWTNYVVSARMQFPAGSFGGGLGGRLNPATGAHYAAWIYPEGSSGGGLALRLIKFSNFGSFTQIAQASLASVGTNFHTVAMAFHGSRIAVYFDGNQMINATDSDYASGSISLDMWTDATGYVMSADDVTVNNLVKDDSYAVNQNSVLSVPASGVLVNDTSVYGTNLTASVLANPAHGTVTLTNNGGFTYTPSNNFNGADSFTYQASDSGTNLGGATVSISVNVVNTAPEMPAQTNRTISELTTNTIVNTATDSDLPAQTLTYSLTVTPATTTATINTNNGIITFSPGESQGPGTYTFTTIVTDNGAPPLKDTNSFQIAVLEVNTAPTLPNQTNRTVNELTTLTVNNGATDTDSPANTLTYSLTNSPTGATISSAGVITWTPTEGQGPGDYTITAIVRDNGTPQLSATNSFSVHVNEVNAAPVFLATPTNRIVPPLASLVITNAATDSDVPANTLTYSLVNPPLGATISSSNGVFTWIPTQDQDVTTNVITTVVTDNGTNQDNLSTTNSFIIVVNDHPIPAFSGSTLLAEGCFPTNNAADPGETVTMLFSFRNVGLVDTTNLVVTLLETNGVLSPSAPQSYGVVVAGGSSVSQPFTFTASGTCGGIIAPKFQFEDNSLGLGQVSGSVSLGGTGTLYTENFDAAVVPALPAGWSTTNQTSGPLWITTLQPGVTNTAYVTNSITPNLTYLVSPLLTLPLGQSQFSFRHRYGFERSSANNPIVYYDGGVLQIKIGTNQFRDIIVAGGSFLSNGYNAVIASGSANPMSGSNAWGGTFTNNYTNVVVNLPLSAAGQNVQLRWVLATDNLGFAPGWWVDTLALNGALCCLNNAPVLSSQTNRTIDELTTIVVTNTASDSTAPPSGLTYSLTVSPPATNATISSDGVISWTPTEAQGPGTYTLTTVVSDNASPPLSATNSFDVTVLDVNSAPILPGTTNYTIGELTTLIVTNNAADSDLPANLLSYTLLDPPANATINTNGVITFIPSESQGPGVYTLTTKATDDGSPPLSATNSFTVTVAELNSAPTLPGTTNFTIAESSTLIVTNTGSDPDLPANALSYMLLNPPANVTINTNGVITFTPNENQGSGEYTITTVVTDDGSPPLSATNSFTVAVTEINTAPALPTTTNYTIAELTTLTVTNTASDSDLAANALSFTLLNPPANATINTNGVITFTPNENQGPGEYTITTVVTDDGSPPLSATNSFTVTVTESNNAPTLPGTSDHTIAELSTLTVTNTASDSDLPANALSYVLLNPPANVTINTNGVIAFTPSASQAPGVYTLTTVVTDDGSPPLSATNSFTVTVTDINSSPTLPGTTNYTIAELTTLIVTNTASDSDLPANALSYTLLNPPANATINTNGVITFTPSENQGPGVYTLTTVVTDDGSPPLSATNLFSVTVTESNSAPILPATTNYTIAESSTLTVTNTASDSDLPANLLSYTLINPPANATINTNGVIVFTPSSGQAPSANIFETVVTDDGVPPLSATNIFTVVVSASSVVPGAPTIVSIGVTNGEAVVTWTSVTGRIYQLQYKEDILGATWQSVEPDITATAGTTSGTNTIGEAAQRVYRVRLLP